MDRNDNGIIDSVDDTQDLIKELIEKGYTTSDIHYSLIEDGQHNAKTWAEVIPEFLKWGWGDAAPVMVETIIDQA
jgi:hypothetical protein